MRGARGGLSIEKIPCLDRHMAHDPEFFDLDVDDRALALHEAGHAIVARALGATVEFIEINLRTGDGEARADDFLNDTKNLAVCVAGCKAEQVFAVPRLRSTKKGDFRVMRKLLMRLPDWQRRAARVEAYRLADEKIRAKAEIANEIARKLLLLARINAEAKGRIEGDELAALLDR